MTDVPRLLASLPSDDPSMPDGVDEWTDATRKYIRPLADALRSALADVNRTTAALAACDESWSAICGQQLTRIAGLEHQIGDLTDQRDHERRMDNEWLTQLHDAGKEIERLKIAMPRETSASIAAWQNSTFGPATTTFDRVARSSRLIFAAMAKVSNADLTAPRPNLSRAIRATEELAELIELLVADDADPKSPREVADIDIVLRGIDAAHGVERADQADAKMLKNRGRTWSVTGDGHGQHVASEEHADG